MRLSSQGFRVVVTSSWIPGGVSTWTHEFASQLADHGHDVTCIFVKPRWLLRRQPPPFHSARYRTIWLEPSPSGFLLAVPRFLSSFLRQYAADFVVSTEAEGTNVSAIRGASNHPIHIAVLHVAEPDLVELKDLVVGAVALAKRILQAPLWFKQQQWDVEGRTTPWYWQWVLYLTKRRLEKADAVVCVSHSQTQAVQRVWDVPHPKLHIIYNGIDTRKFRPPPGRTKSSQRRLLFVGGSSARKGVDLLLDAFALLADRYPGVHLDLVGGWNWSSQQLRMKRLGITSRVSLFPYIDHDDMPAYYERSYAFIAPTRAESFGRTLAEAMACAVPVISTRSGSIPEIVHHGVSGILVPWGNVGALAGAVSELLDQPRVADEMGREGRRRVEERFAWDVVLPQWEELFERMAALSSSADRRLRREVR